jgi:carboxymethylenebutenolidase
MHEKELRVETADGRMRVFTVHPDGPGPFPVAVLYMDGVGYREQIKENARRFASGGFYVVAPDLYYRAGEMSFDPALLLGGNPDPATRDRMMQAARSVSPDRTIDDTRAALHAIADDPAAATNDPIVSAGYCMGARIALHAASAMPGEVVAAAGIHPGSLVTDAADSPHHDLKHVRGELYFAFAEVDRTATPESVEAFRHEMEAQGIKGEVERIPGATHGFAMADLPVYDDAAAERHFAKVLELWERNVRRRAAAGA